MFRMAHAILWVKEATQLQFLAKGRSPAMGHALQLLAP
jgi:hypothetical protein